MRIIHSILIIIGCLLSTVVSQADTRVALVSTCASSVGQDVLALAEVKLVTEKDIVLVERLQVERILQEQKLAVCGLNGYTQALTVGKLLGVEVFAALEIFPNSTNAIGLVAFDARSGVRLVDVALPAGRATEVADKIVETVRSACVKRERREDAPRTLCVLGVRNADLPREFDSVCQSIGLLLERRLVHSPGVVLLERRRLEEVNRERDLPTGESLQKLRTSLVLIELEVSRATNAVGLVVRARLADVAGNEKAVVRRQVGTESPADLAEALVEPVLESLHASRLASEGDARLEARRFLGESEFLVGHGEWQEGLRAAESAAALDPGSKQIRDQLIQFLVRAAGSLLAERKVDVARSLDLARRAVAVATQMHSENDHNEDQPVNLATQPLPCVCVDVGHDFYQLMGPEEGTWFWYCEYRLFPRIKSEPTLDTETQARLVQFQQSLHKLIVGTLNEQARQRVHNTDDFEEYTKRLSYLLADLETYAPSAEAWVTDVVNCVTKWLAFLDHYPLRCDRSMYGIRFLARTAYWVDNPHTVTGYHVTGWRMQSPDWKRLRQLVDVMEAHHDPLVQVYGQICRAALETGNQESSRWERYLAVKGVIQQGVMAPGQEPIDDYRSHFYNAGLDAIDLLLPPDQRRAEYLDWFDFMLSRHELEYWVIVMATDAGACDFRHFFPTPGLGGWMKDVFQPQRIRWTNTEYNELAANLNQVTALWQSPDRRDVDTEIFSWNMGSLPFELARLRLTLMQRRPDLRSPVPWQNARVLLDVCGQGDVLTSVTDEHTVYTVLCMGKTAEQWTNRVVRLSLVGVENPQALGEFIHQGTPSAVACLGDGKLFVGTKDGIDVFSLAGGPRRQINLTHGGLPSAVVQALAFANGQLYAALGEYGKEAFLVRYNPVQDCCTILASSRRKERQSPLDDIAPPFYVNKMIVDSARQRVLFTTAFGMNVHCFPLAGLWEIASATGHIHQLATLHENASWAGVSSAGQVLVSFHKSGDSSCDSAENGLVAFDPVTQEFTLPFAGRSGPAGPQIAPTPGWVRIPRSAGPPFLLLDGWLWFRDIQSTQCARMSVDGKQIEYLPPLDPSATVPAAVWYQYELVNKGRQLLVGEYNRLWLLTLPEKLAKETP